MYIILYIQFLNRFFFCFFYLEIFQWLIFRVARCLTIIRHGCRGNIDKKTYRHQLLVYRMRLYMHYYSTCTCTTTVHISTKSFIFFPLLWSAVEVTAAAATLTFRVKSIETLLRTHSNVFVFFFLFLFFLNMHQSGHSLTLATRPASTEDVKLQLHQMLHSRNDVRARQRSA